MARLERPGAGRVYALVLLAAMPLFLATPGESAPEDPVEFWRESARARELMRQREWNAAAELLDPLARRHPENSVLWERLASCRYNLEQWDAAAAAFARAAETGTLFPFNAMYNAACCHARGGDADRAFEWLRRALEAGLEDRGHLARDSDLESLHGDPRWSEITGAPSVRDLPRDEGWRLDLDFLVAEVHRLHPDPFRVHPAEAFGAAVASLRERIPRLSDEQIRVEMQKILVLLGDGHSGIDREHGSGLPPGLPVQLYLFEDGLFVIGADAAHEDLIGSAVLSIGRRPVEELLEGCRALVSRDNDMGLKKMAPLLFTRRDALGSLGAIDGGDEVPLEIRDRSGAVREVRLAATDFRPRLGPMSSWLDGQSELPLWLAREDENYWFEPLEGAVFFQFNSVRNAPGESISDFAARLRRYLEEHDVRDLIVDLRHNGGGNGFLYPPLVKTLVAFEAGREDARIWVLVGRNTFSAAQNFATDVDWWTDAVFAGEPTGSRPNAIGEHTVSPLPYSGLRVSVSSRYHQQSFAGDERAWIAPDIPVAPTSTDYFAKRDAVLEAVLRIVREGAPE